ncbi:MAG: glucosaminidase domain-containing protein [Candidatus Cloacimonetes bacterium]|nr:glucosaminidase domain-containing protein [Candidatus Cloacimonadota bacterium]
MRRKLLSVWVIAFLFTGLHGNSLRDYEHVKEFYEDLAQVTIDLAIKYNTPPAAILAMAGLESGYGQGYIARITGNILSLGANKGDAKLPPLYLPEIVDSGTIIFDEARIETFEDDDLEWKMRPGSLKKDYRPQPYSGTPENLTYFKHHPKEKLSAQRKNLEDFMTKWLNTRYQFQVFAETRRYLDSMVKEYGKAVLFSPELNMRFLEKIGGKPGSFNYRKTWRNKVVWIMENAELVKLARSMYYDNLSFEEAWDNNN